MGSRRITKCSVLMLLLAVPWSAPQIAQAEPEIHVERRQGVFQVRVETPVAVGVQTAWQVLTDYDRLAQYVPDMRSSRIVSGAGEPLRVRQEGGAEFLFFTVSIEVELRIEETPPERLTFTAVGGNMKQMHGEWRITRTGQGILLGYEAAIEPKLWVPPLLGTSLMRRNVARQVAGVVNEMLRRQAGGAAPSESDSRTPR